MLAQDFRHGEHQIGGRDAFTQAAREFKAHNVGREEVHRLAQHGGLGLDTAHAPAHHTNAVDHGGVAVGAHQGVGVVGAVLGLVHTARQVFEVDLVHDAKARGHHAKGVEGLHAPFHEFVALAVALEFELHVQVQRLLAAVVVHHDGVVHHQIHGHQGLDLLRVLAQALGGTAHGGQVGQQGHAGKVLQHHARNDEGDLILAFGLRRPLGQLPHMLWRDLATIAIAQHRFEDDTNRDWQAPYCRIFLRQCRQGKELAFFPGSHGERPPDMGHGMCGCLVMGHLHTSCRGCGLYLCHEWWMPAMARSVKWALAMCTPHRAMALSC